MTKALFQKLEENSPHLLLLEAIKELNLDTAAVYQSFTPGVNVQLYSETRHQQRLYQLGMCFTIYHPLFSINNDIIR